MPRWPTLSTDRRLSESETIMPRALLVGRNPAKLEAISEECGGLPWTTDLDAALANPEYRSQAERERNHHAARAAGGAQSRQTRSHFRGVRRPALDHRPGCRAGQP